MLDLREFEVWAKTSVHKKRVAKARDTLVRAASAGRLVISTSWGKDSVALCDLAIDTLGPVDLMHMASPYELPGYESIVEHFTARAPIHTVPPRRTLAEYIAWLQVIGLGYERE